MSANEPELTAGETRAGETGEIERLRASAEYYRMLVDMASDAIFIVDDKHHYVDVNEAACTLLGYTREELLSLSIPDVVPVDTNPGQGGRLQQMQEGQAVLSERFARRKDGSLIPIELNGRRLPDGRLHAVVRDISARKRAEAERDRLAAVVEQTNDFVIMADLAGAITYVNPAMSRIWGLEAKGVIGRFLLESFMADTRPPIDSEVAAAIASGTTWAGSFFASRADGETIELEQVVSPLRDAAGTVVGWVAAGRDITHERTLEAQLRQAQKMEAMGRLAGGVAHDINNLLAAIRGYTELTHLATNPDDEVYGFSAEVLKAADRAKLLTQRLLTFARQQPTSPETVDVNAVVEGVAPMLHQIVDERTPLAIELAPEPVVVRIDVALLEQAVLNLVINARDAIAGQGTISLATRLELSGPDRGLGQAGRQTAGTVVVSVTDTGSGISPEDLPHLFDPFFTTKPASRGTGLGLSIVYAAVTGAGGTVSVNSKPGAGACFELLLPALDTAPDAISAPAALGTGSLLGTERVLLVEDEAAVRSFEERVLSDAGYRVAEAASAEEAVALIEQGPPPALLITDVLLPTTSGPELADLVREKMPGLPVLFVSGYDGDRLSSDGRVGAGTPFLSKPFASEELLRAVRSAINGRTPPAS